MRVILMLRGTVPPLTLGLVIVAVAVLVPMGRRPLAMRMGWPGPATADPGVVPGGAVPIAANPYKIGAGAYPDDHLALGGRRRGINRDVKGEVRQNGGSRSRWSRESGDREDTKSSGEPKRGNGCAGQMIHGILHQFLRPQKHPLRPRKAPKLGVDPTPTAAIGRGCRPDTLQKAFFLAPACAWAFTLEIAGPWQNTRADKAFLMKSTYGIKEAQSWFASLVLEAEPHKHPISASI